MSEYLVVIPGFIPVVIPGANAGTIGVGITVTGVAICG